MNLLTASYQYQANVEQIRNASGLPTIDDVNGHHHVAGRFGLSPSVWPVRRGLNR